jgi:hypothetical protein
MASVLAYVAALVIAAWGVAHLVPTTAVVDGFGSISKENRLVIVQEWIAEGITMLFLAALVALVTALATPSSAVVKGVYSLTAAALVALAVLTALTGGRGSVIFFKICPVLLTSAAALLVVSMLV